MASFNPLTCEIDMSGAVGGYRGTRADLSRVPSDPAPTISLVHEYVHFLQAISSGPGLRVLGELVAFGVHGALVLAGEVPPQGGTVKGYRKILPILKRQPTRAGRAIPGLAERADGFVKEAGILFEAYDPPYLGQKTAWEIDQQEIDLGVYTWKFWGIVTPGGRFRPITPGLLSEGMARRIDRWYVANTRAVHTWAHGRTEDEHYNGVRNVLAQPRYARNISKQTLDQITVIVCCLGLATTDPDQSVSLMLDTLAGPGTAGGLAQTVADTLRKVLADRGLLTAQTFNKVLSDLQSGQTVIMDRREFLPLHEHLKLIRSAAEVSLLDPVCFADPQVDWNRVRTWMDRYSLPPIVASDGEVDEVDGISCSGGVTEFLREVVRVLF